MKIPNTPLRTLLYILHLQIINTTRVIAPLFIEFLMGKTLLKKVKYQKRERKNIYSTKTEESHKIKTTKVSSTYCLKQNHPFTTRSNLHIKVIK